MQSSLAKFANVDGQNGKAIMPFPHSERHNPECLKYDKMSVADRLEQIRNELSPDEITSLLSFVLLMSGGTPENTSFYEFLHWWALCHHSYEYCVEYLIKYKFRGGQSSFAIKFFQEAKATNRLSYAFNTAVSSMKDVGTAVHITVRDGRTFKTSRVISTIPLNVLKDVTFDPPLSSGKSAATKVGHINKIVKVHAECRNPELRSWSGVNYPQNQLMYAIGDGTTPSGNTHIVAFGGGFSNFTPEKNIQTTQSALQGLVSMDIERIVSCAQDLD